MEENKKYLIEADMKAVINLFMSQGLSWEWLEKEMERIIDKTIELHESDIEFFEQGYATKRKS